MYVPYTGPVPYSLQSLSPMFSCPFSHISVYEFTVQDVHHYVRMHLDLYINHKHILNVV
jgi:hypothetical protein